MYTLVDAIAGGFFWKDRQKQELTRGYSLSISISNRPSDNVDPQFIIISVFDSSSDDNIYFRELRFRVAPLWQQDGKTDQWAIALLDIRLVERLRGQVYGTPKITSEEFQELIPVLQHYCLNVINEEIKYFIFGL